MTLQIICIIISVLTMAFYLWGKLPMGLVSILSMLLFIFTGCIDVPTALSGISNSATVMMLAIFILATGFNRTQFSKKCANAVANWAKGSLTKVMIGYTLLAILLTQLTQAPMIVMTVICPSLSATCKELNVSPSKAVFGIGVAAIACCCALPIAAGSTVFAEFNGYLEASNYTDYQVSLLDPFIARFPIVIASFERGVLFDVAFGGEHFSWEVLKKAHAAGVAFDFLGSDLITRTRVSGDGLPHSLFRILSGFLAAGIDADEVFRAVTTNASSYLHIPLPIPQRCLILHQIPSEVSLLDGRGQSLSLHCEYVPVFFLDNGVTCKDETNLLYNKA